MDVYLIVLQTSTQMLNSSISYLIVVEIEFSQSLYEMIRSMESKN